MQSGMVTDATSIMAGTSHLRQWLKFHALHAGAAVPGNAIKPRPFPKAELLLVKQA